MTTAIFLHGIETLAFLGGSFLGMFLLVVVLATIAARPEYYRYFALGYFLTAAAISLFSFKLASALGFFIGTATTFPWIWATTFLDVLEPLPDTPLLPVGGVAMNALIFFFFGRYVYRRASKPEN